MGFKSDAEIVGHAELKPEKRQTGEPVIYSQEDGVATITLNRPDSMNAMTDGLMRGIRNSLAQVVADDSIRVVILTGSGRGFCAGVDLAQMADKEWEDDTQVEKPTDVFVTALSELMACPVPTIARVNGPAAGGGFGLALACDIVVAAQSAFFVAPFVPNLGVVPDLGSTWSIPLRVGRSRALGITLLGERIGAEQAQEWGLIWSAVADDELDKAVSEFASVLKRFPPGTATRTRKLINAATHNGFDDQMDLEIEHQRVLVSRYYHEGAQAFLEKRKPHFDGERD